MSFHRRMVFGAILCAVIFGVSSSRHGRDLWYGHGTTAVLMRSARHLVAGVDSKESFLQYGDNSARVEEREICKATQLGPYYALVAGLDRGSNGYDALGELRAAVHSGDSLDALAGRVAGAVSPELTALLSQIRTADPAGFVGRFQGQVILQLSLLGVENRTPQVRILEFTDSGSSSAVSLTLKETRCPGDCSRSSTAYFLGAHDEIDRAVRRNPKLISMPSDRNVEALIEMEKLYRPDIVGGPVTVFGMDEGGISFVNPGACPSEVLAAP